MNDGKINVELDYKDFYAILELTGKDPDNEFLLGIHKRFLGRVFDLAAQIKTTTEWMSVDDILAKVNDWPLRRWELRGRVADPDPATFKKIQAIKSVRMVSSTGLKEAKDYVDSLNWNTWISLGIQVRLDHHGISELQADNGYLWELRSVGFND